MRKINVYTCWAGGTVFITYAFRFTSIFRATFPYYNTKRTKYPLLHGIEIVGRAFRKAKYSFSFKLII